jgi:hypothetical protein
VTAKYLFMDTCSFTLKLVNGLMGKCLSTWPSSRMGGQMFVVDESSILLTVEQAEQLAAALLKAAEASRKTPW